MPAGLADPFWQRVAATFVGGLILAALLGLSRRGRNLIKATWEWLTRRPKPPFPRGLLVGRRHGGREAGNAGCGPAARREPHR